jgi:NAD dependent epimerase/dehydratase
MKAHQIFERTLVTGADGFIGSHLTESLLQRGYKVRAFVMYNSFNSWGWLDSSSLKNHPNLEVISGDIRDPNGVENAMENCDSVIHLAALIAIPFSYNSPSTYVETNINGTLNVLQAARKHNLKKVVHTSTSEVYGTAKYVPIDEGHMLQGQSPYSASKIGADSIAYSFFSSFATPVVIVRPFNTYGPRQSARAVIPTIITQIANGVNEIKLGAISPTRDFTYVQDTVNGFIAALESESGIGEVINIGSNFEISVGDTALLIASLMDTSISIISENERFRPQNSEVERLWADNSKALKVLNWQPKNLGIDGMRKGLEETIKWFTESENLKKYKFGSYNI